MALPDAARVHSLTGCSQQHLYSCARNHYAASCCIQNQDCQILLQIWALQSGTLLHVGSKTNRATVAFQAEIEAILDSLPERLPAAPVIADNGNAQ